ncbi:MAG: hypothetical protein N2C14_22150, partial [Planctomycetales bacterium]
GADREAIRECVRILREAERPLVLFPEGTWFRQNERLGPLQDGVGLIVRQAARKNERPIHALPVTMKYWVLEDPRPDWKKRLTALETSLRWRPRNHEDWVPRIQRLSNAMLTVLEIEHFGEARIGSLDERRLALIDSHLAALETRRMDGAKDGDPLDRLRNLRHHLTRELTHEDATDEEVAVVRGDFADMMHCELMFAHSQDYLLERPSFERITEAIERLEEALVEGERISIPLGVSVQVGEPLAAADFMKAKRKDKTGDPLVQAIGDSLRSMSRERLEAGPPSEWNCPAPLESPAPAPAAEEVSR